MGEATGGKQYHNFLKRSHDFILW